jgi:hypothetical protein
MELCRSRCLLSKRAKAALRFAREKSRHRRLAFAIIVDRAISRA